MLCVWCCCCWCCRECICVFLNLWCFVFHWTCKTFSYKSNSTKSVYEDEYTEWTELKQAKLSLCIKCVRRGHNWQSAFHTFGNSAFGARYTQPYKYTCTECPSTTASHIMLLQAETHTEWSDYIQCTRFGKLTSRQHQQQLLTIASNNECSQSPSKARSLSLPRFLKCPYHF